MGSWEALGWAVGGGVLALLFQHTWSRFWSLGHRRNFRVPPEVHPDPGEDLMRQLDIIRNARFGRLRVIEGHKKDKRDKNEGE